MAQQRRSPSHRWFRNITFASNRQRIGSPSHRWFRKQARRPVYR
ncbi:hypothetical protein ENHAE0001_0655 [Enhydrobacter aerosaccus SK60]|nr:hypothetical protein ENHAE0001_0655 [Enhydrobacter aerosaccus SK60]